MNLRHRMGQLWLTLTMRSSHRYWEQRYRMGLTSGSGSEGALAEYKAGVLNRFVKDRGIRSVVEFGCGDGQQLALATYPDYLGLDVSATAIELCRQRFAGQAGRSFLWYDPRHAVDLGGFVGADLTLSLDVIYHLVEDDSYRLHLRDLFGVARRYVAVYSSNRTEGGSLRHVRHRRFTDDVQSGQPGFRLLEHVLNPHASRTFADFYFFERVDTTSR
jgi:SAM-dependent methyltransferase